MGPGGSACIPASHLWRCSTTNAITTGRCADSDTRAAQSRSHTFSVWMGKWRERQGRAGRRLLAIRLTTGRRKYIEQTCLLDQHNVPPLPAFPVYSRQETSGSKSRGAPLAEKQICGRHENAVTLAILLGRKQAPRRKARTLLVNIVR
jgi:hypothetical protein